MDAILKEARWRKPRHKKLGIISNSPNGGH
jgi:hypothetical protein